MTQYQLDFAEPLTSAPLPAEGPWNELVRRHFPGFEYILYDFRLGSTWHRVIETTTRTHGHGLAVSSYLEVSEECVPQRMTLAASWHFEIGTSPVDIANSLAAGMEPDWTRLQGPRRSA